MMRSQQELRELPNEFTEAMDDLKKSLEKIPVKIRRVIAVAQKWNLDRKLVRSLLKQALEGVLSERSIDKYLAEVRPKKTMKSFEHKSNVVSDDNVADETVKSSDIAARNIPEDIIEILCPGCRQKVSEKLGI